MIQTTIKTKYASFLAQNSGDQWEIGQDIRDVCILPSTDHFDASYWTDRRGNWWGGT